VAEAVLPARRVAWAITGAANGVDTVASCTFRPITFE